MKRNKLNTSVFGGVLPAAEHALASLFTVGTTASVAQAL